MVKVKICGITNVEDAQAAAGCGADLLGFVFVKDTPRYVGIDAVKDIVAALNDAGFRKVSKVGLFKDEDRDKAVEAVEFCGLDLLQLHGEESSAYCREVKQGLAALGRDEVKLIKTFKIDGRILPHGAQVMSEYTDADFFLFDTFCPGLAGGTGKSFDPKILAGESEDIEKPFFVAGGLTPDNVKRAVKLTRPYAVDVSSGVEESPGIKDHKLLKEFIKNAKSA
ncbi:MAG: phosphoribosylanthranilate isomerase [Candidatus Omnitrophota bacterium]